MHAAGPATSSAVGSGSLSTNSSFAAIAPCTPPRVSVRIEGEAPICAATIIQRLQRVGQQWQGVGGVDILDDAFREPWLQLEPKPVGRLLDDLGE